MTNIQKAIKQKVEARTREAVVVKVIGGTVDILASGSPAPIREVPFSGGTPAVGDTGYYENIRGRRVFISRKASASAADITFETTYEGGGTSGTGVLSAHALSDTAVHTGTLLESQAPWALSQTSADSLYVPLTRQVIAGNGLTGGGALSANVTLTLGTPTSLSASSANTVGAGTHSHAIDSTIARSAITITGTGALGGGGDLTTSRTITLNTPGGLSVSSTNSVATNHTHAITSSSNPGAAASLLASDASGYLILPGFQSTVLTVNRTIAGATAAQAYFRSSTLPQMRLEYDGSNYMDFTVDSGGNFLWAPTGDVRFNPGGKDVHPLNTYDLNLGLINKKWLTIHAAELWVETLVAQNTIATIGGRILVGPTSILAADLTNVATTISVKYNNLQNGDIIYMEGGGFIEFMQVTSSASGTGPYTYTVTRNLDGTGANPWNAGDALFNTGQAGSGFIDLYSYWSFKQPPFQYIYNFNATGSVFSSNYADTDGWNPLGDGANNGVGDIVYFGAPSTFTAIGFLVSVSGSMGTAAMQWEYWNGSSWTSFTPTTGLSALVTGTGKQYVEWNTLSGWATTTVNGNSAYWVRWRMTNTPGTPVTPAFIREAARGRRQWGPTIVGNIRNSSTFNDWNERWAIGNLNGLYEYGTDTFGVAFGKPTSGTWIAMDDTNGFRIMYHNGTSSAQIGQWTATGTIIVGTPGVDARSRIEVDTTSLRAITRNSTVDTANLTMSAAGLLTFGPLQSGTPVNSRSRIEIDGSGIYFKYRNGSGVDTTKIELLANGNATFTGVVNITSGTGYGSLSDKPTSLSAINSAEGTKLSGIAAGATVGATWGTNLGGIPTTLTAPSGDGLYLSSTQMGYYHNGFWRTYIDNLANFEFRGLPSASVPVPAIKWDAAGGFLRGGTYAAAAGPSYGAFTTQWYTNATTGALMAGGGNVYLDATGLNFVLPAAGTGAQNTTQSIDFISSGTVRASIFGSYQTLNGLRIRTTNEHGGGEPVISLLTNSGTVVGEIIIDPGIRALGGSEIQLKRRVEVWERMDINIQGLYSGDALVVGSNTYLMGGLRVGNTVTPAPGEVRSTSHIFAGGNVYIGNSSGVASDPMRLDGFADDLYIINASAESGKGRIIFRSRDDSTARMIINGGSVGIGETNPQGRLHTYDTDGGTLHNWRTTGIAGTRVTIVPNGTGDCVQACAVFGVAHDSSGNSWELRGALESGVSAGSEQTVQVAGDATDNLHVKVKTDGQIEIVRNAGARTWSVCLSVWWR